MPVLAIASIAIPFAAALADQVHRVESPNGVTAIEFCLKSEGTPTYSIDYQGEMIVQPSRLGLEPELLRDFLIVDVVRDEADAEWTNEFGELRTVPDRYRELHCDLQHKSGRQVRVTFRAYDEAAALQYSIPEQKSKEFTIEGERTEFRFPEGTYGYEELGTEGPYRRVLTDEIRPWCERPLTLEFASGKFASLNEAANSNYPRMLLSPIETVPGALVSALGGRTSNTESPNQRHEPRAALAAGDSTPWRVLILGGSPGDLLERNYVLLNLNPPSEIADTAWIKPGKVMRETTLTTANAKAVIDFADKAGIQYVHFDQGWYGSEDLESGDATTVRRPNLDFAEVIRYGRDRGIGAIVYVDRRQIKTQRDILFPLFEKWGLKGVKLGFVDVGPQAETVWISDTIALAAKHHLMLNIHDGYRATGNNRTFPNLMTVEGIRGNERMPTPEHNCTLPFTRYVGGPGDYTICYYDPRIQTTHAHQLAMSVISFSPLQWIFWYDRPEMWHGEPEIEFFREVPTVWDETRVLHGAIGEYATIARRKGEDWFLGTINNSEPRQLSINLDFLPLGKRFAARIYSDDPSVATRTKVGIESRMVDSSTAVDANLLSAGGQAIWISPATAE
jgi:alpha-glucosidase